MSQISQRLKNDRFDRKSSQDSQISYFIHPKKKFRFDWKLIWSNLSWDLQCCKLIKSAFYPSRINFNTTWVSGPWVLKLFLWEWLSLSVKKLCQLILVWNLWLAPHILNAKILSKYVWKMKIYSHDSWKLSQMSLISQYDKGSILHKLIS